VTLRVLYDEARITVVEKPSGMTSEEASVIVGHKLVHRIDKGTSGLLMLAHDARAAQRMQRILQNGGLERVYWFVAHGRIESQTIESSLVRDRGDGLRGSGVDGKPARTEIEVLSHGLASTTGRARLVTGRTHQIRIHLAEAGHPLVGETVYVRDFRGPWIPSPRLMLHAWSLRFSHPMAKREVFVESPPPIGQHP